MCQLAQAYQNSHDDQGDLRLLEITAAAFHALAAMLYHSFHPDIDLQPPYEITAFHASSHYYVDLYHTEYKDYYQRYPYGLLNLVGYWTETQIFGGVVLFDRGDSGEEVCDEFL